METMLPVWQTDTDLRWFGEQTELMHDTEAAKGQPGYSLQRANLLANKALLLRLDPSMLSPGQKQELRSFLSEFFLSQAIYDDLNAGYPLLEGPIYRSLQRTLMKLSDILPFERTPVLQ